VIQSALLKKIPAHETREEIEDWIGAMERD
jgi:hypothetical protein